MITTWKQKQTNAMFWKLFHMNSISSYMKLWKSGEFNVVNWSKFKVSPDYNCKIVLDANAGRLAELFKTKKHSLPVIVWGCFSYQQRGALTLLPINFPMNACQIHWSPGRETISFHGHLWSDVFQHDKAPCRTACAITSWFQKHQIQVLEWAGNSPDLNPIENLWQIIK